MNANYYFEDDPWDRACRTVSADETPEDVAEITIQCTCSEGEMAGVLMHWTKRLAMFLGDYKAESENKTSRATAVIRTYYTGTIVRIFIDEAPDVSENFEISTLTKLILWRPDSNPQMHLTGNACRNVDCQQLYAERLGELL